MTEIMPVPRNLSFTVLPAGGLASSLLEPQATRESAMTRARRVARNFFIIYFSFLKFIFAPGPGGKNNENQSLRMDAPSRSAVGSVS